MKILDIFTKHLRGTTISRHEPEGVRVLSDLYWRIVISIAALLTVLSLGYGVWGLLRVLDSLSSFVLVPAPPPPALNRAILDATMRGFEIRRTQFELLKATPGEVIPDPSR